MLYGVLSKVIHDFVPLVYPTRIHPYHRQRISGEARAAILRKRKAWKRWSNPPCAATKLQYNQASRDCANIISGQIAKEEEALLNMNKHSFYSYVSGRLRPTSHGTISLINDDGNAMDSPQAVAQCFSTEFSKNFSTHINNAPKIVQDIDNGPVLDLINVDVGAVRNLLLKQRSLAAGPDGIPGLFYNRLASVLASPLTIIYQQSLHQRSIPDMWRKALIIPLYKGKGSKDRADSYRPISLSDVACKILERLIVDQIKTFWMQNNLICHEQHGFIPCRSTVSNLLVCDSVISDLLNDDHACDVILLDFARAFDKVSHTIAVQKLAGIGIRGQPLEWVANYLSARTQAVSYCGVLSEAISVTSGVIQGSVIGPMLFVAFINDLPSQVSNCDLILFADDSKAVGKSDTEKDHALMQADLNAIGSWSEDNQLPLSIAKSVSLHYGCNNQRMSYQINGAAIRDSDTCADLGVIRTSDFRYKAHINSICLKASRLSAMVFKLFSTRNKEFLCKLFITYIRPLLEYASTVWNPNEIGLGNQLEGVQRRFTSRLFGRNALSYEERLHVLGIQSLMSRRSNADLTFTYKLLHNLVDITPAAVGVELNCGITRSAGIDLVVRRAKTERIRKCFNYKIATLWNKLPAQTKMSSSLSQFKSRLNN